jgi:hypothetical protein
MIADRWKIGFATAILAFAQTSCEQNSASLETEELCEQIVSAVMLKKTNGSQNPFAQSLGLSGIPTALSFCGNGFPTPLDSLATQKLIACLLVAEGYQSVPTTFIENDFTATAQGYDTEKRIGFIVGDVSNFEVDLLNNGISNNLRVIADLEDDTMSPERVALLRNEITNYALFRFARRSLDPDSAQILAVISKIESPQQAAKAYLALETKSPKPKLSIDEIKLADKMAEDKQRYLAIISIFDKRFQISYAETLDQQKQMSEVLKKAEKKIFFTDEKKWQWIKGHAESIQLETERKRLTKLAYAVREYIAWARRNVQP